MRALLIAAIISASASVTCAQTASQTGLKPNLPIVPPPTQRDLRNAENEFNFDPRDPVARLSERG